MRIPDEVCADVEYETAPIEDIRANEVRDHKVTSPVPQIDGLDSLERGNETTGAVDKKLKSQYPRNCEFCDKHLRNNLDFRKHIVDCVMARK